MKFTPDHKVCHNGVFMLPGNTYEIASADEAYLRPHGTITKDKPKAEPVVTDDSDILGVAEKAEKKKATIGKKR